MLIIDAGVAKMDQAMLPVRDQGNAELPVISRIGGSTGQATGSPGIRQGRDRQRGCCSAAHEPCPLGAKLKQASYALLLTPIILLRGSVDNGSVR